MVQKPQLGGQSNITGVWRGTRYIFASVFTTITFVLWPYLSCWYCPLKPQMVLGLWRDCCIHTNLPVVWYRLGKKPFCTYRRRDWKACWRNLRRGYFQTWPPKSRSSWLVFQSYCTESSCQQIPLLSNPRKISRSIHRHSRVEVMEKGGTTMCPTMELHLWKGKEELLHPLGSHIAPDLHVYLS